MTVVSTCSPRRSRQACSVPAIADSTTSLTVAPCRCATPLMSLTRALATLMRRHSPVGASSEHAAARPPSTETTHGGVEVRAGLEYEYRPELLWHVVL